MQADFTSLSLDRDVGGYGSIDDLEMRQVEASSFIREDYYKEAWSFAGTVLTSALTTRFEAEVIVTDTICFITYLDFPEWDLFQTFKADYLDAIEEYGYFLQTRSIYFNEARTSSIKSMIAASAPASRIAELQAKWYCFLNLSAWYAVNNTLMTDMTTELVIDAAFADNRLGAPGMSLPDSSVWAVSQVFTDIRVIFFIDPVTFDCIGYAVLNQTHPDRNETVLVDGWYKYVKLDDGVEIIAFMDFNSNEVIVPSMIGPYHVKAVGGSTFEKHSLLESVVFSDGIGTVDCSFYKCLSLKIVSIPKSVSFIGNGFYVTPSLEGIFVDDANPYYMDEDGVLFNKDKTELIIYPEGREAESYTIPETVHNLDLNAFRRGPTYLKELYIHADIEGVSGGFDKIWVVNFHVYRGSAADVYLINYESQRLPNKIKIEYLD